MTRTGWGVFAVVFLFACGDDTGAGGNAGAGGGAAGADPGGAGSGAGPAGGGGEAAGAGGASSGGESAGGGGGDGGSGGAAAASQRVFVTSAVFPGDLGGLTGADQKCQDAADAQGLQGTYIAWLSDFTDTPTSRFEHYTTPYVRVDGTTIATSWDDLIDTELDAPIDVDETGATLPAGDVRVWTGTGADGLAAGGSCVEWTTTGSGGVYGTPTATDASWSFTTGNGCENTNHLYCFEK